MATYGYDKDTDYSELINQAVAAGDYRTASIREQQRNEKIRGEGLTGYQTTSHYAAYLPKTDQINSGMDKLAENKQWKYNQEEDPAWHALRKEYLREADRQTRDTMGTYAGMTGGVPSTAAVAAAQQAGNYQRSQLADRIPELMNADYNRWANNRELDRAELTTLAGLDQQAADYSLNLQQWDFQQRQQEIANAMNRWATTGVADDYVAQVLGVPVGTTTQDHAYQQWQMEFQQSQRDYERQQTQRSDAYNRAMASISLGILPDAATLAAAGISQSEAAKMAAAYRQKLYSGGFSGSSGSAGGNGSKGGTKDRDSADSARMRAEAIDSAAAAMAAGAAGAKNAPQGYNAPLYPSMLQGNSAVVNAAQDAMPYVELLRTVDSYNAGTQSAANAYQMLNRITNAYRSGTITEAQANTLLKRMGFDKWPNLH